MEIALSAAAPSFRLTNAAGDLRWHRTDRRHAGAGCHLAGHRPGCTGQFFHPERQDVRRTGAGGVPVRSAEDYRRLFAASRRGNYPLMRTYSGTDDFVRLAEMYVETINIAWAAVPLFWFNQMDGRGPHDLEEFDPCPPGIAGLVWRAWHPRRTQRAPSLGRCAMRRTRSLSSPHTFLPTMPARFGVRDYVAQLMFNSPPGLSDAMDLAKMLAVLQLIEPLGDAEQPDPGPERIQPTRRDAHLSPDPHGPAQLSA